MMATMDALTDRSRGTSLAELGFADAGLDAGPPHPTPTTDGHRGWVLTRSALRQASRTATRARWAGAPRSTGRTARCSWTSTSSRPASARWWPTATRET